MSGFLNLGGQGGAMVGRNPARALNTPWVPAAARPVLVVASVTISAGAGDAGLVELNDLTSGTRLALVYTEDAGVGGGCVALVLPGHQVSLVTTDVSGAPTFFLQSVTEVVL